MELSHRGHKVRPTSKINISTISSIWYHNIFDYPLTLSELEKWQVGKKLKTQYLKQKDISVTNKYGFYFLEGKEGSVLKRLAREKYSKHKLRIVQRARLHLARIPTIKMLGVTGALAMKNASEESDIDLMIITSKDLLWTTRILVYLILIVLGFNLRRAGNKNEKDKLCLNIWMDESDLIIKKRNIFTAHELAQIVPLINKDKTYEKLLFKNKWIIDYWPHAVARKYFADSGPYVAKTNFLYSIYYLLSNSLELVMYKLQYQYMKSKITREVITKTRAFFHPFDWGKFVLNSLK